MTKTDKSDLFLHYWRLIAQRPEPEREYRFDACIGRKHRFDFAFVAELVAVEVDGGTWAPHGGRHATDADREKGNLAASLGWRMLHFSPKQLKDDPAYCVELVIKALEWKPRLAAKLS
jgi:very-short-patch-repair endonuclease